MNKGIFLGLFGLLILSSLSFAWEPTTPEQWWMATMYDHTRCAIQFTATGMGGSLLESAYDYGTTMGYSAAQLDEIEDLAVALEVHQVNLYTYMANKQYLPFMAELVATNADLAEAKQMYGNIMKEYVRGDYSRISPVVSEYQSQYNNYLDCVVDEEPHEEPRDV